MLWHLFRLVVALLKDYGLLGIGLFNTILLFVVGWKFFSNHWQHQTAAVEANAKAISDLTDLIKINAIDISYIKGKLNGKS